MVSIGFWTDVERILYPSKDDLLLWSDDHCDYLSCKLVRLGSGIDYHYRSQRCEWEWEAIVLETAGLRSIVSGIRTSHRYSWGMYEKVKLLRRRSLTATRSRWCWQSALGEGLLWSLKFLSRVLCFTATGTRLEVFPGRIRSSKGTLAVMIVCRR